MSLLTAIHQWRRDRRSVAADVKYRVLISGIEKERELIYSSLGEAERSADQMARHGVATCVVVAVVDGTQAGDPIYVAYPPRDDSDGENGGVREPRRPLPGPSAGAIELDSPE